jgi:serine/threonine-protein phosphatase with EF-hand domain
MKEIIYKYKSHATRLLHLFENIYSWLPIASLIDDHIFVTHGGISDLTDLNKIKELKRQKVDLIEKCFERFALFF